MNKLFLFILSFLLSTYGWSANRYSVATGNLSSTSTWSATSGGAPGASVPTTGDNAYIETYTVTCDTAWSCNLVTLTSGTLDTNDQTCTWGAFSSSNTNTRALDLGASAIGITGNDTAWNIATGTNLTITAGTSVITCTGSAVQFNAGAKTYNDVRFTGSGTVQINQSGSRFNYLTRTGTAAKTDGLDLNTAGGIIITNALTLNGNSAINRLFVFGFDLGDDTVVTLDGGSVVTSDNCDYRDINFSKSTDLSAGSVGDCGGNTNITFTTAATQTATMSTDKNWSDVTIWTSRVPLPQDDVSMAGVTGGTLTADMPRLGKTIDWTGATGSPTWSITSNEVTIYGGITLISGMTHTQNKSIRMEGRGAFNLTSAGKSFYQFIMYMVGGSLTLQDAFSVPAQLFQVYNGTFDANDFNVTILKWVSDFGGARSIYMGSGIWTISGADTATLVVQLASGGMSLYPETSKIIFSNVTSTAKTFQGAGLTFNNFEITGGGTGAVIITGSNTFNNITVNAPKTVNFTDGTTQTVSSFTAVGTAVNGITLQSTSAGSPATLSDASGLNMLKYCTIQDIAATGGANWVSLLAMGNVDVSGNTGWIWNAGLGIIMIND